MTRIIAGTAGSLTLAVPGSGTRPTADRVREAIFSALEARDAIHGARTLDLFAGSGALGLEALSRGAAHVTLVEKAASAARVCRQNATAVTRAIGRADSVTIAQASVTTFLAGNDDSFDLVFLDPPYARSDAELATDLRSLVPHLGSDAVVVVERAAKSPEPLWPSALVPISQKRYGDTAVFTARGCQSASNA